MTKKSNLTDHIPNELKKPKLRKTIMLLAWVSESLRDAVNEQRRNDGLTWRALLEGMFNRYLSESGAKKKAG